MFLLNYLGHASLFLACLYAIYWLFFRKEAFHQLNRALLWLIMVGTLSLPLAPAPDWLPNAEGPVANAVNWAAFQADGSLSQVAIFPKQKVAAGSRGTAAERIKYGPSFSPGKWLILFYYIGLILLAGRLAFQIFATIRLLNRGAWEKDEEGWLVRSTEFSTPFSFWNVIFLPAKHDASPLRQYILEHERVHRRQWHSADLLLAELFCLFFWFHPAAWQLNRTLRARLEHIADEAVLQTGVNRKSYQYSLLRLATGAPSFRLANQFNQSLIKTRIVMMNAKKSPAHHQLKYLAILPLALLLVLMFNDAQAQVVEVKPDKEVIEVNPRGKAATSESAASQSTDKVTSESAVSVGSGTSQASVGSGTSQSAKGGVVVGSASSSTGGTSTVGVRQAVDPLESVFVAIGAEFPVERLPQMKEDLKEQGILLNIEELDYNSDQLITRLKLSVRTTDGKMHGNGFSYNDGKPIDEPVVFYVSRDEGNYGFGIFSGKMDENVPAEVRSVIEKMENGYFVGKIITE